MTTINTIYQKDFERDPAGVLHRVETGECLIVLCEGRPVAELRPIAPAARAPRPFGLASGAFLIPAEFDEPFPEELVRKFEGR